MAIPTITKAEKRSDCEKDLSSPVAFSTAIEDQAAFARTINSWHGETKQIQRRARTGRRSQESGKIGSIEMPRSAKRPNDGDNLRLNRLSKSVNL